ncbi:MAG TPA: HEAT repeat domain-containing protein [Verrucomicrobiae bacterium]
MRSREQHFRLILLGSILLLSGWLCFIEEKERNPPPEQYADIVKLMDRGLLPTYKAPERFRRLNTNVYLQLIAEMEIKDGYLRTKYISVYPNLPEFLRSETVQPLVDVRRRERARFLLEELLETEPDILKVVNFLGNESPGVRQTACRALLSRSWKMDQERIPWPQVELLKYLDSQDERVRDFILHLFQQIVEKSNVAETNFTRFLSHRDDEVVLDAVRVILKTGGSKDSMKPHLQKLLQSTSDEVRYQAAVDFGTVDKRNTNAMAVLMSFAQSTNTVYRPEALWLLGSFETNAAVHSPDVKKFFWDPDKEMREAATNTFYLITPNIKDEREVFGILMHHQRSRYTRKGR